MPGLHKNARGIYVAQWYDEHRRPQRKQVSLRTRTKRDAKRLLDKLHADYLLGEYDPWDPSKTEPQPEVRRLGDAVDVYMASCAHLSPNTLRTPLYLPPLQGASGGVSRGVTH